MLITGANIEALNKGFSKIFRSAYDNTPLFGDRIATTIQSTHGTEVHGWMKRILKMPEWLGPRLLQTLNTHAYGCQVEGPAAQGSIAERYDRPLL
jgi:phage major head subunit gpT-like protein